MLFDMSNVYALFQEMMHTIVKDMEGCIWYLYNILIYGGNTKAKHQSIVEKVLQQCVEHGLAMNLCKSEFHIHETIFISYINNNQKVKMDSFKLETISKWPIPAKKK